MVKAREQSKKRVRVIELFALLGKEKLGKTYLFHPRWWIFV